MTASIKAFICKAINRIKVDTRNHQNPYLTSYRKRKQEKLGITKDFTIISNNYWAGLVYKTL